MSDCIKSLEGDNDNEFSEVQNIIVKDKPRLHINFTLEVEPGSHIKEDLYQESKSDKRETYSIDESDSGNEYSREFESICPYSQDNSKSNRVSSVEEDKDLCEVIHPETSQQVSKHEFLQNNQEEEKQSPKLDDFSEIAEPSESELFAELSNNGSSRQSKHLFRDDNVRKAMIRALNSVIKSYVGKSMQACFEQTGIDLKKYFLKYRDEVFECFKTCMEKVLGYSLSDIDTKEVYAIFFYFCLKKKKAIYAMIKFSSKEERKHISEALKRYKKQGITYTKADGEYCVNHIVLKIAKKLYFSCEESQEVFKHQILDTRKKIGIKDREAYLHRVIKEMDTIPEND